MHYLASTDIAVHPAHQVGLWPALIILVAYALPRLAPYLLQAWILSSDRRTQRYLQIQQLNRRARRRASPRLPGSPSSPGS